MRLIKMTGGLGNQMFIYALYLRMRRDFSDTRIDLSDMHHYHAHNGYEMHRAFALPATEFSMPRWGKKIIEFLFFKTILERHQKGSLEAYRSPHRWPLVYFKGFYQSERYFADISDEVRAAFTFNEALISEESKRFRAEIEQCEQSVSLHVRRGDYLQPPFNQALGDICTPQYYKQAIQLMREAVPEAKFFIFSDDHDWCRKHLDLPHATHIDCNRGTDSWQDMMLMRHCRHHIIANSTFSWWGAWLAEHPTQRVMAPGLWNRFAKDADIVPARWTKIPTE